MSYINLPKEMSLAQAEDAINLMACAMTYALREMGAGPRMAAEVTALMASNAIRTARGMPEIIPEERPRLKAVK